MHGCQGLAKLYPDAHCALHFDTPLQLLIATILSAVHRRARQSRHARSFSRVIRTAAAFASADLAELEKAIQSTGFFRNKAKSIKACCQILVDQFGGEVPGTMEELVPLPGVGARRRMSSSAMPLTCPALPWIRT